ncbi:MAG: baseplate J/gp47 family protein [Patescibacteria group bacterium]
MKLPISFTKEKKENSQVFLALVLRNEKVTSVIFEKIGNAIKYISHDEEYFKNTIEDAESEEFLDTLDKVITSAETALPESVETKKTIFGLKENWVEDGKIKKEYLEKLKKASDELSLEPIGFLVSSESIINLVTKEEGAPITAILADVGKKYITVSWVKGGKVLETRSSEIHQSASYTVDTLLKHFQSPGNLPARIILLDSEEDELTQEFISHQWSKSLAFLHLPQIASLPEDASVKAVLLGAATQMETQLLYDSSKDIDYKRPAKIIPDEIEKPGEEQKSSLDYVSEDSSMEFFGFVENSDVAKTQLPQKKIDENIPESLVEEKTESIPEDVKLEEEKKQGFAVNALIVSEKIKKFLMELPAAFKKPGFNFNFLSLLKSGNKKILAVLGIVVLLFAALFYLYLFKVKATIDVFVIPKEDEKTASVTFSSVSSTDIKNSVIASQFVSVTEEGSLTRLATGKKDIGNPAKGKVTVFNISDSAISLAAGTEIISANKLKFTLDTAVKIASGSSDPLNPKSSTADVNVTADEIGQEYNLPSGTKFTIGSNSSVAAKNDSAFSGGSKKQVTVVSKDDLDKLLEDLPKSLEDKARVSIKTKVESGKTILNTFVDKVVEDKSFDKKESDQANQVTLKGTVIFKAASYTNSDIETFASSLFSSSDTEVQSGNLEISAKNIVVEKNNDVNADLTIKAKIFPKVDKNSLLKQIKGVSLQKAKNILSNLNQVTNVKVSLSPNIPFLPKNMPRDTKNIILNFTSN